MRRRGMQFELLLFALAGLFFLLGYSFSGSETVVFDPSQRSKNALRVVTWNVGGSLESGGTALQDQDLEHVARVLESLDPDLCFLQEIDNRDQLGFLRSRLPGDWSARMSRRHKGSHVVALAQRGRLKGLRIDGASRGVLGVLYQSPVHGNVSSVGIHADALSSRERNRQIGDALNALLSIEEADIQILAGDFNLDLDLDKRRDLFTDNEHLDVETYNYVAERLRDAAHGRGSTAEPDRRLDYIFVGPTSVNIGDAGPWKQQRTGDMDHDPVIADLRTTQPSP